MTERPLTSDNDTQQRIKVWGSCLVALKGLVLVPEFFDILIEDLKMGVNSKLMKFTYTKLGGFANTSNGTKIIGRDQAILESWT